MRKVIVTAAMLLAGTSLIMAQANPPGGKDERLNENAGKLPLDEHDPHPRPLQGVGGGRVPPSVPRAAADPSGQQTEKNNEEIGKLPQGDRAK